MNFTVRVVFFSALAILLVGCAGRPVVSFERPAPQSALPARPGGDLARIEEAIRAAHGSRASGFELLDRNEDGLRWRLALIDSARHSIDMQYYLWYGDAVGKLLAKRLLDAADRGVRVRLLVDDLNTLLHDRSTLGFRDDAVARLDTHPNLEIRLFNPWKDRALAGRVGESIMEVGRVNQRMHHKAMIVDNRAAILGGRNIGDGYMGMDAGFNFHDLDVMGIGPVARQASDVFDMYWNSDWVVPVSALGPDSLSSQEAEGKRASLAEELVATPALERFPLEPRNWSVEFDALAPGLHIGSSRVATDVPTADAIRQAMVEAIYDLLQTAQREVLIVNAYIIPGERALDTLHGLAEQGIEIGILTNSLASHDVPAVNSHYGPWRRPLVEAGVDLYEMRHDAAIQPGIADTPPTQAGFMGLHSKAMVVDRERVYIGSMNFDPRSVAINTEMGVIVESPGLAEALAQLIERDMLPANSWRVEIDGDRLSWVNDRERVYRQPARDFWQRVQDVMFKFFPKDLY